MTDFDDNPRDLDPAATDESQESRAVVDELSGVLDLVQEFLTSRQPSDEELNRKRRRIERAAELRSSPIDAQAPTQPSAPRAERPVMASSPIAEPATPAHDHARKSAHIDTGQELRKVLTTAGVTRGTTDPAPVGRPAGPEADRHLATEIDTEHTTVEPPVPPEPEPEPIISVVVPALNEARNLPHVFARLPQVDEVILVDGGSTDDTVAVARRLRPDIRVVTQNRKGKGNALACGFAACTGDIIVMIDADGSTDPGEIPHFIAALRAGADFAKGSRFRAGGGSADITRLRRAGTWFLTVLVNLLFGTRYSDLCYGYNAFWACHLDVFDLDSTSPASAKRDRRFRGDGFEIAALLNLRAARARLATVEVSSFEHNRIHGVSNLNAFTDGIRVLRTILSEWRPRRRPRTGRMVPAMPLATSRPEAISKATAATPPVRERVR